MSASPTVTDAAPADGGAPVDEPAEEPEYTLMGMSGATLDDEDPCGVDELEPSTCEGNELASQFEDDGFTHWPASSFVAPDGDDSFGEFRAGSDATLASSEPQWEAQFEEAPAPLPPLKDEQVQLIKLSLIHI